MANAHKAASTRRLKTSPLLTCVGLLALIASAGPASSQTVDLPKQPAEEDRARDVVIVTGARNLTGVLQGRDSDTAFGLTMELVDTPRSVTQISDLLLDRYNVRSVYDFTAVAAGTYTGSYFGVPGSLNIRGTIADNYFNGFLQIANLATFPTPVGASSSIDIVRGPPSPAYGAGQIGGYMNFVPKSARGSESESLGAPAGAASVTVGSYDQREGTLEGGVAFDLGGHSAGVYGFLEVIDSGSFYLGRNPESQVAQVTFDVELAPRWKLSASAQYVNSEGYMKTIGWNRVTQALIDRGEYTSGTSRTPIVQPGHDYITLPDFAAAKAAAGPAGIQQYVLPAFGVFATPNQYTELDPASVRTVALSPRQTGISPFDINEASTPLLYAGVTGALGDTGTLRLESYSQTLDALNYQSFGFGSSFDTSVNEERITYGDTFHFGDGASLNAIIGASYRRTVAQVGVYLNSGVNVQDRWDLSRPITPDDVFNAVFTSPNYNGYRWDNDTKSEQTDAAIFAMGDLLLFNSLSIVAGARSDNYDLQSIDTGTLGSAIEASQTKRPTSYSASVSYRNPFAVPYITYARSYALNIDQGGALRPSLISGDAAVGESTLSEIGLKTSQFGGRLYASADLYRQENQYLDVRSGSINSQRSKGFEAELRWLATSNLGLTGTMTFARVRQLASGPGSGPFLVITPQQAGITGAQGYGGMFVSNADFLGLGNGYDLHTTPRFSASLFATYDQDGEWGLTAGVAYNSWTGGSLPGSIKLPEYALVKAGAYAMVGDVRADLYIDNVFDEQYFIAEYDVDSNASVLPGLGREIHFKLSKQF